MKTRTILLISVLAFGTFTNAMSTRRQTEVQQRLSLLSKICNRGDLPSHLRDVCVNENRKQALKTRNLALLALNICAPADPTAKVRPKAGTKEQDCLKHSYKVLQNERGIRKSVREKLAAEGQKCERETKNYSEIGTCLLVAMEAAAGDKSAIEAEAKIQEAKRQEYIKSLGVTGVGGTYPLDKSPRAFIDAD